MSKEHLKKRTSKAWKHYKKGNNDFTELRERRLAKNICDQSFDVTNDDDFNEFIYGYLKENGRKMERPSMFATQISTKDKKDKSEGCQKRKPHTRRKKANCFVTLLQFFVV